jgi:hypothetical protein
MIVFPLMTAWMGFIFKASPLPRAPSTHKQR